MGKSIQALLFDFDGTLLDTNELIIQTFQTVLNEHYPGKYERVDILPFLGPTLVEIFNAIDPAKTDQLIKEYREWNSMRHDELVSEFDGVSETLKLLKATGVKMAIVSTKKNDILLRGIDVLDVDGIFDVIVGMDDVVHAKPHPEPILLALKKLGVEKEHALMIGDNSHDIEGGQNAGVATAGVAWSAKGEAFLQSFNPDYMLHHISDLLPLVRGEEI